MGAWTTFSKAIVVRWHPGRLSATDWNFQQEQTIFSSGTDPDGLAPWESIVIGSDVMFAVGGGGNSGAMSWTRQDELRLAIDSLGVPLPPD
ncbi:MAG: hypothetical protein IRZ16_02200 [Myxococcaceae bacterium]|nr:hypothetical protein [Myxococcaceae bacterium]